jgi:hypothetical protein
MTAGPAGLRRDQAGFTPHVVARHPGWISNLTVMALPFEYDSKMASDHVGRRVRLFWGDAL